MKRRRPLETPGASDPQFEDVLGETWDGPETLEDRRLRSLVGPVAPLNTPPYGFERVMLRARRRRQRTMTLAATAVVTGIAVAAGGVVLGFHASGAAVQTAGCAQGAPAPGNAALSDHGVDGVGGPGRAAGFAAADSALGRKATMERKYEWAIGGVLTAAALGAGIVAGCAGSSGASSGGAPSNGATATPTQSNSAVAPPASASQTPSGSPSATAAALPRCHTVDLTPSVSIVKGSAATGHELINLTLINSSGHTCTIYGYPGMMLQDQNGAGQATHPTRDHAVKENTITVPDRGAASSTIRFDFDIPGPGEPATGNCEPPSYSLLITPPDETTQLTAPIGGGPVTVCLNGAVDILPFVAGAMGANQ